LKGKKKQGTITRVRPFSCWGLGSRKARNGHGGGKTQAGKGGGSSPFSSSCESGEEEKSALPSLLHSHRCLKKKELRERGKGASPCPAVRQSCLEERKGEREEDHDGTSFLDTISRVNGGRKRGRGRRKKKEKRPLDPRRVREGKVPGCDGAECVLDQRKKRGRLTQKKKKKPASRGYPGMGWRREAIPEGGKGGSRQSPLT